MKKIVLFLMLGSLAAFADTNPGTYMTWLGNSSASGSSNGSYSEYLGAFSGYAAEYLSKCNLFGTATGYEAEHLTDCVGVGYRALQEANGNFDVFAFGNNAGRASSSCQNCIWFGRDTGRGLGSEANTIRFLSGFQYGGGDTTTYTPDPWSVAYNVYFFGNKMSDIIDYYFWTYCYAYVSPSYYLSEYNNDVGFITYSDMESYYSNSGFITWSEFSTYYEYDYIKSYAYSGSPGSVFGIKSGGKYTFSPDAYWSHSYGISFSSDEWATFNALGFIGGAYYQTIVETVHEKSIVNFETNTVLAVRNGATTWVENPDNVLIGGTNKASAVKMPNYVRSIANVQSVNGKTGAINLTANDVRALPALPTNTVVRLVNDDDAYAAIRLILTTMGATVVTNAPSASN